MLTPTSTLAAEYDDLNLRLTNLVGGRLPASAGTEAERERALRVANECSAVAQRLADVCTELADAGASSAQAARPGQTAP